MDYADYEHILPKDFKEAYSVDQSDDIDQDTFLTRFAAYSAINGGFNMQLRSASRPGSPAFGDRPFFAGRDSGFNRIVSRRPSHNDYPTATATEHTALLNDDEDHTVVNVKPPAPDVYLPLPLM